MFLNESHKELASLKCVPCEGGIPPLKNRKIEAYLSDVPGWGLIEEEPKRIRREFKFKDFNGAMDFVNRVAEIAEDQGHHPDIEIHWNEVTLTLYTHAIDGLHDNDFIMAAKIDELID